MPVNYTKRHTSRTDDEDLTQGSKSAFDRRFGRKSEDKWKDYDVRVYDSAEMPALY